MDNCKHTIISQLAPVYRKLFENVSFSDLEEIRFRIARPVMLYSHGNFDYLSKTGDKTSSDANAKITDRSEMNALAASFCANSVYAYVNDMKDGFITLRGGHRVGLAGKCIMKGQDLTNIADISGINLRIARAYPGCAQGLLPYLKEKGIIKNTLLVAPPQCGKTTFLRDLARIFSVSYKTVIVDERSEIAGTYEGMPQFDIGPQTDVLDRFPKTAGIMLALRSLSPQIIITDELGGQEDIRALQDAANTGCRFIASIHGDSLNLEETSRRQLLSLFQVAILLGRKNNRPDVIKIQNLR